MDDAQIVMLAPAVSAFAGRRHGLFIDGAFVDSRGDVTLDVFDPATGHRIADIVQATDADVDHAVSAARAAFDAGRWTGLAPSERERILLRLADLIELHTEELAQLETLNQGKSINISRHIDIGGAPAFVRYVAGLATKITGHSFDVSINAVPGQKYTAYTRREPIGVVGAIAPWNFPMLIGLWKVIPALAAGCTVVLKPSEVTPLTSLRLAELASEAGVPPGVFNVVTGDGAAGRALVAHPLVDKVTFTGSTAAGKAIARTAADRMLRTSLELGGKNPAIFLRDAPIEAAVGGAILGAFFNNGQVCAASSRLYVAREIHDEFVAAFANAVNGMSLGSGLNPMAQINPVVSAAHRAKILQHIDTAISDGAKLVAGGGAPDSPGFFVNPTVIIGARRGSGVQRNEIFGPVVSVTPFDTEEEALALANDTEMGLTASIWTNDLKKAMNYIPKIRAGTVWINAHNLIDPNMPFGGFKESGIGREFGVNCLEGFTETKSVCIAH